MERPDLSTIPLTPGVYLYKDESGRIIYVGKARCLRRRVASYFRDVSALTPKTVAMLRHAVTIDTLSTTTEKEALLLEASLIKKHRPRYNIVLRDDKQYVLFRIGAKHPYPRLEIVRKARRDDGRYFGPFTSASAARETWKTIHRAFPLRRCSDRAFGNRVRACLYHHMGQCLGPCVNEVPSETYAALLEQVSLLLSGRSGELVDALRTEMEAASQGLDFERAAVLRDRIRALERTVERQAAVLPGGGDLDVVGVVEVENGLALGVLFVRQGVLLDGRSFFWPGLGFAEAPELLWSFLGQFYGPQATIPPRIVVPWLPDEDGETGDALDGSSDAVVPVAFATTVDASLADVRTGTGVTSLINASHAAPNVGESTQGDTLAGATGKGATHLMLETALAALRGGIVRIALPRNPAENRLVDMAMSNAREEARRKADTPLQDLLARALHLAGPPHRIEAVDVSHTGGRNTRVGMVVFEDGKPFPEAYRTYAFEDGDGDDYGTLAAWAGRRVESGPPWPDLLLVDGGRGQLAAVVRAFEECGMGAAFAVASIAKARTEEGRADRRAGNVSDRIFLPGRANPLPLRAGAPELLFLQHVRDTVHDYSIGKHRRARAGAALTGELQRVEGIGPATARALWERFDSLQAMAEAGVEGLAAVPGVGRARAAALHVHLVTFFGSSKQGGHARATLQRKG